MKPGPKPIPLADRFWPKVDKRGADDCWPWTASLGTRGYGQIGHKAGKPKGAHRVAYELAVGPIPTALFVLHTCDNPACCNPAHLFLGTQADNMADMLRKGRKVVLRGTEKKQARLDEDKVRQIRSLAAGGWLHADIAAAYGIHPTYVGVIAARKKWAHVAG